MWRERSAAGTSCSARFAGRGSRALASQALTAVKLSRLETRPFSVSLVGGVLMNKTPVRTGLVTALKDSCGVRIAKPRLSPGDASVELTAKVVTKLARSDSGATVYNSLLCSAHCIR